MYNMYPQQQQQYTQQLQRLNHLEQQGQVLRGRPVTSIDEVRAIPVDFDGSTFYFPDTANQCIYTKSIGLNGQSSIQMYALAEIPTSAPTNDFVTKTEFAELVAQIELLKQGGQKANDESKTTTEYSF